MGNIQIATAFNIDLGFELAPFSQKAVCLSYRLYHTDILCHQHEICAAYQFPSFMETMLQLIFCWSACRCCFILFLPNCGWTGKSMIGKRITGIRVISLDGDDLLSDGVPPQIGSPSFWMALSFSTYFIHLDGSSWWRLPPLPFSASL